MDTNKDTYLTEEDPLPFGFAEEVVAKLKSACGAELWNMALKEMPHLGEIILGIINDAKRNSDKLDQACKRYSAEQPDEVKQVLEKLSSYDNFLMSPIEPKTRETATNTDELKPVVETDSTEADEIGLAPNLDLDLEPEDPIMEPIAPIREELTTVLESPSEEEPTKTGDIDVSAVPATEPADPSGESASESTPSPSPDVKDTPASYYIPSESEYDIEIGAENRISGSNSEKRETKYASIRLENMRSFHPGIDKLIRLFIEFIDACESGERKEADITRISIELDRLFTPTEDDSIPYINLEIIGNRMLISDIETVLNYMLIDTLPGEKKLGEAEYPLMDHIKPIYVKFIDLLRWRKNKPIPYSGSKSEGRKNIELILDKVRKSMKMKNKAKGIISKKMSVATEIYKEGSAIRKRIIEAIGVTALIGFGMFAGKYFSSEDTPKEESGKNNQSAKQNPSTSGDENLAKDTSEIPAVTPNTPVERTDDTEEVEPTEPEGDSDTPDENDNSTSGQAEPTEPETEPLEQLIPQIKVPTENTNEGQNNDKPPMIGRF